MKLLLVLALLIPMQAFAAGDSPHDLVKCQQLLQHYDDFWRHDANEYFFRMQNRNLHWRLDAKEPDPYVAQLFLFDHSDVSEIETRIRTIRDTLGLEVRNESANTVRFYELGPADLVTHTEAVRYGSKDDDHNQMNSLAFSARSYAHLYYPIMRSQDLVLALNVLPYQVDETVFLGRRTPCASQETDYWFNAAGEKFCFKALAQLTTSARY